MESTNSSNSSVSLSGPENSVGIDVIEVSNDMIVKDNEPSLPSSTMDCQNQNIEVQFKSKDPAQHKDKESAEQIESREEGIESQVKTEQKSENTTNNISGTEESEEEGHHHGKTLMPASMTDSTAPNNLKDTHRREELHDCYATATAAAVLGKNDEACSLNDVPASFNNAVESANSLDAGILIQGKTSCSTEFDISNVGSEEHDTQMDQKQLAFQQSKENYQAVNNEDSIPKLVTHRDSKHKVQTVKTNFQLKGQQQQSKYANTNDPDEHSKHIHGDDLQNTELKTDLQVKQKLHKNVNVLHVGDYGHSKPNVQEWLLDSSSFNVTRGPIMRTKTTQHVYAAPKLCDQVFVQTPRRFEPDYGSTIKSNQGNMPLHGQANEQVTKSTQTCTNISGAGGLVVYSELAKKSKLSVAQSKTKQSMVCANPRQQAVQASAMKPPNFNGKTPGNYPPVNKALQFNARDCHSSSDASRNNKAQTLHGLPRQNRHVSMQPSIPNLRPEPMSLTHEHGMKNQVSSYRTQQGYGKLTPTLQGNRGLKPATCNYDMARRNFKAEMTKVDQKNSPTSVKPSTSSMTRVPVAACKTSRQDGNKVKSIQSPQQFSRSTNLLGGKKTTATVNNKASERELKTNIGKLSPIPNALADGKTVPSVPPKQGDDIFICNLLFFPIKMVMYLVLALLTLIWLPYKLLKCMVGYGSGSKTFNYMISLTFYFAELSLLPYALSHDSKLLTYSMYSTLTVGGILGLLRILHAFK